MWRNKTMTLTGDCLKYKIGDLKFEFKYSTADYWYMNVNNCLWDHMVSLEMKKSASEIEQLIKPFGGYNDDSMFVFKDINMIELFLTTMKLMVA
jgi:hypothetical protein